MKEQLKKQLTNADMQGYEKEYILAVVQYIDENMETLEKEELDFTSAINKMIEVVKAINNCNTGVEIIDNITELRQQTACDQLRNFGTKGEEYIAKEDYRTVARDNYVINYISILSNYGGLFKYVCEGYKEELNKTDKPNKKKN